MREIANVLPPIDCAKLRYLAAIAETMQRARDAAKSAVDSLNLSGPTRFNYEGIEFAGAEAERFLLAIVSAGSIIAAEAQQTLIEAGIDFPSTPSGQ